MKRPERPTIVRIAGKESVAIREEPPIYHTFRTWPGQASDIGTLKMRIIAGTAGGIPLLSPSDDTRPTTDRVRGALFSILADRVLGARVLDLFAGSGALGLEAVSRGARSALCLESSREACTLIRRNAEKAKLSAQVAVRQADVFAWLKSPTNQEEYDLVFADPPYRKRPDDSDFAAALLGSPRIPGLIASDGLLVLESHAGPALLLIPPAWRLLDQRTYGTSRISFLQPRPPHSSLPA